MAPNKDRPLQKAKVVPVRIREARKARRLRVKELAAKVEVSHAAISGYESGNISPNPEVLIRLANTLNVPLRFFLLPSESFSPSAEAVFFRSFKSATKLAREACEVETQWTHNIHKYLVAMVNLPEVNLPNIAEADSQNILEDQDIETIAQKTRRVWGLGDGPLSNVIALLERNGITVVFKNFGVANIDAFSYWQGDKPFIVLGKDKQSAVRSRFDAAHELGHLIMHRSITSDELEDKKTLSRIEKEANRFASAFLMPASTFSQEIYTTRLNYFIELKKRWLVSIQAMIYRCDNLGIFSTEQILNMRRQVSARHMRKKEPLDNEIPLEEPTLLRKSIEIVLESQVKSPAEMINDLSISASDIETICGLEQGQLDEHRPAEVIDLSLRRVQGHN